MTGLGFLPHDPAYPPPSTGARAVSSDGSVVVGYSDVQKAFRWKDGVMVELDIRSHVCDVSGDGSVAIGYRLITLQPWPNEVTEWSATRWERQGPVGLGRLADSTDTYAMGISADGSVIVGYSYKAEGSVEAVRWKNNRIVGLGTLGRGSGANAVSADGSVIVGWSTVEPGGTSHLVRWQDGTIQDLGILPGVSHQKAQAVSGDGSVIVGTFYNATDFDCFLWDAKEGIRSLEEVLTDRGIDLTGWDLRSADDISDDGRVIVGFGINPAGHQETWRAVIPEPSTILLLCSLAATLGLFHVLRRHRN
ncbi:MAG: hypothetical protein A2V70_19990 [Planctomycetes bacterium RBG_13_63_9]|nr:MAG: hypothetical protein A2V70_19990 [Planctomycetes bacterium RBG_13_63_9]